MTTAVDQFILEEVLIGPIESIIFKLEKGEFRDCDIKWLNGRLERFTQIALDTLGKKFPLPELNYPILNEFVKGEFLRYFTTLLNYFKSF